MKKKLLQILKFKNTPKVLLFSSLTVFVILIVILSKITMIAQTSDECLACHDDKTLMGKHKGKPASVYVDAKKLGGSVHAKVQCVSCHADLKGSDFPHSEDHKKPQCAGEGCHTNQTSDYQIGLHGRASAKGDPLAPDCKSCHGSHEILKANNPESPVSPLKVPFLCGRCHSEGTPVQLQRNIPQTRILENYTESIHGEALLKKGLTVTATCASCHTSHKILPHTDARSSIARKNIASTCIKCHARIEDVHKKVINGQLWEKEAHLLPACVDCHQPHKVRKVFYEQNLADAGCKKCHENHSVGNSTDGKSMYVSSTDIQSSSHNKIACSQCHIAVDPKLKRPCESISINKTKVECGSCHTKVNDEYQKSMHGTLLSRNDASAPRCADCHGSHTILPKTNPKSSIFPLSVPKLCSKCHQEGEKAAKRLILSPEHQIVANYTESIHGKDLLKGGLTVTATCADCHTPHSGLPPENPLSSINPANISSTCGKCHFGVQEIFDKSIHSPLISKTDKKLPTCNDCHSAHSIKRTDKDNFRFEILSTCGKCHNEIADTYFDTYHGKSSRLGSSKSAKCSDCHGSHNILPPDNTHSKLSRDNIVTTCQKCHPGATKGFTRYLTHATHHDPNKYPVLFIAFWGMTALLLGTFFISFLHTLLWLPRSIQMRKENKKLGLHHADTEGRKYNRFSRLERSMHFTMILSFLTLAVTGMTLKFAFTPFSKFLIYLLGDVEKAGTLHRFAASALFIIFIIHIIDLFRKKKEYFGSWKNLIFGHDSMLPNKKDWQDLKGSLKWFLGKGPRPYYGRWTYWEKFDYLAVFWGVFIIGFTGLSLWFPEIFTMFMPGWMLNVATIVHSDEALLAAGFIFTIHFFNTHFRPEKFPMDTVIFSGQMSIEELKTERPDEYQRLIESNTLEENLGYEFSPSMLKVLKIFGFCALTIGLSVVVWIILSFLMSYS